MNFPVTTLDQLRPILAGFRKSRELTQAALAAKLGVAQQTYAQLEANPASASVERLFRLLRVLGVELVLADVAADQASGPPGVGTPSASRYANAATPATAIAMTVRAPEVAAPDTQESTGQALAPKPAKPRKREAW